jgi:hypothetical protein
MWFLDRVGTEGIKLTSAGYLPLPEVEAAVAELDLAEEWYGKQTASCRPRRSSTCAIQRCALACSASPAARCRLLSSTQRRRFTANRRDHQKYPERAVPSRLPPLIATGARSRVGARPARPGDWKTRGGEQCAPLRSGITVSR